MGIQGLLKFLKDATSEIHIREYAGKCVAVDTYCWLHRGAFACADKLAKGEKTDQYVRYCMKFIDMLESYNVRPILVFDGCHLPSKKEVEKQRRERRELYMQKGKEFLREGRVNEARDAFTKCISVTPQMALHVMEVARGRGVDCIVAPYEADAQLAFLLKQGYAQAVVTEDSDLLCFGCSKVILKMDLTGRAQEVCLHNFDKVKNLSGLTLEAFRHMCILSGCDYLPNIKSVGLVKACKALKLAKNKDVYQTVRRLHQYIKGISPVDPSYAIGFERADKTFQYQLVLDPKTRSLIPLNPYPSDVKQEDMNYAGPLKSDADALQIAWGNTCVNTGKRFGNFDADVWLQTRKQKGNKMRSSIWASDFFMKVSEKNFTEEESKKTKRPNHSTLRGKEAVINMKNFQFSVNKKKSVELFSQEEASESCIREAHEETEVKNEKRHSEPTKPDVTNDMAAILSKYKTAKDERNSSKKLTLRQRMRSNGSPSVWGQDRIVRSRFFTKTDNSASFVEESEDTDVTHVEETPDASSCSTLVNQSSMADDKDLHNILDEIAQDHEKPSENHEERTKVTPLKRKNPFSLTKSEDTSVSPRPILSSTQAGTPACLRKFKRKLVKPPRLEEHISDKDTTDDKTDTSEEVRRSCGVSLENMVLGSKSKTEKRMSNGFCYNTNEDMKRSEFSCLKNTDRHSERDVDDSLISTEDIPLLDNLHSKTHRSSSGTQKCPVSKDDPLKISTEYGVSVENTAFDSNCKTEKRTSKNENGSCYNTNEDVKRSEFSNLNNSDKQIERNLDDSLICTEDIPLLDNLPANTHKSTVSKDNSLEISTEDILHLDSSGRNAPTGGLLNLQNNSDRTNPKDSKGILKPSNHSPREMSYSDFVAMAITGTVEKEDKPRKVSIYKKDVDAIGLSSEDDENIPYIDDVTERPHKRQKTLGLPKKTSPKLTDGPVKSKYFGEAKASGLRKKTSSSSLKKKKSSNEKTQPKITTLFRKAVK